MTDAISGVMVGLKDGWDTDVTSLPKILNGVMETNTRRKRHKYKNAVFVYDINIRYDLVEPTHTYKDGNYDMVLELETTQSEDKLDDMAGQCKRIIGQTGIAGYDNYSVLSDRKYGNRSRYQEAIIFKLTKYNENI